MDPYIILYKVPLYVILYTRLVLVLDPWRVPRSAADINVPYPGQIKLLINNMLEQVHDTSKYLSKNHRFPPTLCNPCSLGVKLTTSCP